MDFLKFLISKSFFRNLLIAVFLGTVILSAVFIWLRIYTRHGQKITVPDLSGLTTEEVMIITNSKELRFEIMDSTFTDDFPRGTVAKQNPAPGSKVKQDRRLYLTMNAVNPEKVSMPTVTGVSLRQARAILETYGLTLGKITYKPDIAINVVLEQKFGDEIAEPGKKINKGSSVDLVLGKGLSSETTRIPDLTGFNLFMARQYLADLFLNVGAVIYDNSIQDDKDSSLAIIWKQRPEFDRDFELQLGENVDIWLTVDSTKLPGSMYQTIEEDEDDFNSDFFEN